MANVYSCDIATICDAPCAPNQFTSDTYQKNAMLLLLMAVASYLNARDFPAPATVLANECLTCLGQATLRAKQAEIICNGILGDFNLCNDTSIKCLSPEQVQALSTYYTCFILNNLTVIG